MFKNHHSTLSEATEIQDCSQRSKPASHSDPEHRALLIEHSPPLTSVTQQLLPVVDELLPGRIDLRHLVRHLDGFLGTGFHAIAAVNALQHVDLEHARNLVAAFPL